MVFDIRLSFSFFVAVVSSGAFAFAAPHNCRNVPGTLGFPSASQWASLNTTVSGNLVAAVPTAKFCEEQVCTAAQLTSAVFRSNIPGSMCHDNLEQDYDSVPPSLCFPNATTCGQGNVPLYAILAENVQDIQAGVNFAKIHNLRLAVKSSGHDYLGRSTAKNSLLISTHKLNSITYSTNFVVGGSNMGPAVTVGSGVSLQQMYQSNGAAGVFSVGGSAATVAPAGGYVQGGGHSALSPKFGLAADNCLEITVVLANGQLVTANEVQNPDLFWAMRGGGAGSWGVTVSATFRTFPTFDATVSFMKIVTNTTAQLVNVAAVHSKHIFDWDSLNAGQYFYITLTGILGISTPGVPSMLFNTYFPNATVEQAAAALKPFLDEVQALPGVTLTQTAVSSEINSLLSSGDDLIGNNLVMGSRLVPASVYNQSDISETVQTVYTQLFEDGTQSILGHLVAGGQVAKNANISSAIIPAWRTAKTHIIITTNWNDSDTLSQVQSTRTQFKDTLLPVFEKFVGSNGGSYSNEADVLEANFKTTFFGPNYQRLSEIKSRHDPTDLFIVRAGVGSERWDEFGICRV